MKESALVFVLSCCISSYTFILAEIKVYEELLCNRSIDYTSGWLQAIEPRWPKGWQFEEFF